MSKGLKLIVVLVLCIGLLSGCASIAGGERGYNRGGAIVKDEVENLEIDWTAGLVQIAYHSENTVVIEETADRTIGDNDKLSWKMDGKTLRIVGYSSSLFNWNIPEKHLTLTLPEGMHFGKAVIHTTSGDLKIPGIDADEVNLETTSGEIDAKVKTVKINGGSTSGDIKVELTEKTDSVQLTATSGSISLSVKQAGEIKLGTTSGTICLAGEEIGRTDCGSTSGSISVKVGKFDEMKISATSGDVQAELPAKPGFTAEISQTSGSFNSGIALAKDGDTYVCGDRSGKLHIGTTSGDITLNELK